MKRYSAWGGLIIAVAIVLVAVVGSLPAQVSYCSICGAAQETRPYGLRFTGVTLCKFRNEKATEFSAVLQAHHLVAAHEHAWQAPRLVPNPLDENAPPVLESFGYLNAPRVINFTRNVADFADPMSAARWRDLALQAPYARLLDDTLRFLHVPAEGFADRTEFLTWWGRNAYAVYNRLREQTEAD